MARSRFFWQLYSGYVLLVVVCATIVGFAVASWLADDTLAEIEDSLLAKAEQLKDLALPRLRGTEAPQLQTRVVEIGRTIRTRLTVIAADGTV